MICWWRSSLQSLRYFIISCLSRMGNPGFMTWKRYKDYPHENWWFLQYCLVLCIKLLNYSWLVWNNINCRRNGCLIYCSERQIHEEQHNLRSTKVIIVYYLLHKKAGSRSEQLYRLLHREAGSQRNRLCITSICCSKRQVQEGHLLHEE